MTQEHTPGPWDASEFQENDLADLYYVINNDGRRICRVAGYGLRRRSRSAKTDDVLTAEDVANARLIAAAPDLLNIAKMVQQGMAVGICLETWAELRDKLDTAIAKATGKES